MSFESSVTTVTDSILCIAGIFLLAGTILITVKSRFVQLTALSSTLKTLSRSFKGAKESTHTIAPYKALFTAMSTTAGIGTIVGPVIAVHFGGPGALLGFLVTSFLGSAATYTEVSLCTQFKKKRADGSVIGGPMPYLSHLFSPSLAKWYAICCFLLMVSWSGAQSNQVAAIFASPLLGDYRIAKPICGSIVALLVVFFLFGGIKRIGNLATKVFLPAHFVLYVGACLWIVGSNFDRLGGILCEIFSAVIHPYQMASGALVGGIISSIRWGVFKGIHACEGGIGTQTIPHSMAETDDAFGQGAMAMLSTYTAGCIAFLSGLVTLLTGTWQSPDCAVGMGMVAQSFQIYFSYYGIAIIVMSVLLFGFGTILGNSYNGAHCFGFLTETKGIGYYFILTACVVFLGAISDVKVFWAFTDIILAAMAVPHMSALVYYTFKKKEQLQAA